MDEERMLTEESAALPVLHELPAPSEETINPETVSVPRNFRFRIRQAAALLFRQILPSCLIVTAVLIFSVLAVLAIPTASLTVPHIFRHMLGEISGGTETIRFTPAAAPLAEALPSHPVLPPENEAEPSQALPDTVPESAGNSPAFPVYRLDMSSSSPDALGLTNETPYEPDLNELYAAGRVIPPYSETSEPIVLILHTHGTEAYADTFADDFRSQNPEKNVTAVGRRIAERLTESGIGVIHCTELFDSPDFNMAYYNAALAIRQYIADYPSIAYILDIHRDSILSGDRYVNPVTEEGGEASAQIMFVVGTDHGGSGHTGWQDNLTLAVRLQKHLNAAYPTLMWDINLRSASFNEQYTSGSLLVEIGSCASSMEEVFTAAERFADHLAAEILG